MTEPSKNKRTLYEAYLEQENSRLKKAFMAIAPNEDARSAIAAANARLIAAAEDHEFEALIVDRIDLLEALEEAEMFIDSHNTAKGERQ